MVWVIGPFSQMSVGGKQPDNTLNEYVVFHVKRDAAEELHVDTIMAPDKSEAEAIAERQFPDSTIINVRHNAKTDRPYDEQTYDYPSARFINGEFHATDFYDDDAS